MKNKMIEEAVRELIRVENRILASIQNHILPRDNFEEVLTSTLHKIYEAAKQEGFTAAKLQEAEDRQKYVDAAYERGKEQEKERVREVVEVAADRVAWEQVDLCKNSLVFKEQVLADLEKILTALSSKELV